jgi:hypothetical protein
MSSLVYHKKCTKCHRKYTSNYEGSNPCNICQGDIIIRHTEERESYLNNITPTSDKPKVTVQYKGVVYTEGYIGNSTVQKRKDELKILKNELLYYDKFAKQQGWKDEEPKSKS